MGKEGRERKGDWPAHFSDASAAYACRLHFVLLSCCSTGPALVAVLSVKCVLTILLKHLLINTCSLPNMLCVSVPLKQFCTCSNIFSVKNKIAFTLELNVLSLLPSQLSHNLLE